MLNLWPVAVPGTYVITIAREKCKAEQKKIYCVIETSANRMLNKSSDPG